MAAPPCVGGTEDAVVRGRPEGVDEDVGAFGELLPPPLVGGADGLDVGDAVEGSVCVFTPVPDVQLDVTPATSETLKAAVAHLAAEFLDTVPPPGGCSGRSVGHRCDYDACQHTKTT